MEVILQPETKIHNRLLAVGIFILAIVFVPYLTWWIRIPAIALVVLLAGTYRISTINEDKFRSQFFVGFVPLKPQKCNLPGVLYIETKYNAVGHVPDALSVISPVQSMASTLFDVLAPSIGGAFEIWLVTAKGREIPAWQGISQKLFEENVELLKRNSGAEVRGRSQ